MAHGVSEVLDEESSLVQVLGNKPSPQQAPVHLASQQQQQALRKSVGVMGSRRIFSPSFKLKVLDSYRYDMDCKGNQRATARKYGIHRRQIQKWLQCEESLRKLVTESKQAPTVQPGSIVAPASSPSAKDAPALSPGIHEPPHQQHRAPQRPQQQQQPNNGAPASPSLNPNLARLHGDELAVQQQPPPPPPSAPVAAQALAASHQQVAAAHAAAAAAAAAAAVANYRFHGATTGYPDLKDKVPVAAMQPAQYAQGTAADYYELYQAAAAAAAYRHSSPPAPVHHHHHHHQQHHQQQQHNPRYEADLHRQQRPDSFPAQFEPKVESPEPEQPQQRHYAALLAPAEIKSERASPDSLATPVTYGPAAAASAPQLPKKECLDEDEDNNHRHEEEREHSSNCSPLLSSHLHSESIETLPLSPEVSASSDSEMDLPQTEVGCNASDQIRRRSFPVRFKLEVLDAFHKDTEVAGNQRATARKFRINRRQVQKWLSQESDLRGVVELCGNNRQRLGPGCTPDETVEKKNPKETALEESPVDLRTGMLTTDLGQVSPHSNYNSEFSSSLSPNNYIDSSLTPPYSAPGCSLSCCQDATPTRHPYYYCYSPGESAPDGTLKRPHCSQSCCYPQPKKACFEENLLPTEKKKEPEQDIPLCLVKSKRPDSAVQQVEPVSSTVPSPPAAPAVAPAAASPPQSTKKSAILFKPYLDNPVSKPSESEEAPVNNNCQEAWNLNERNVALDVSLRLPNWRSSAPQLSPSQQQSSPPQQQQPSHQYLEYCQVRSAFVRYPPSASVHYS